MVRFSLIHGGRQLFRADQQVLRQLAAHLPAGGRADEDDYQQGQQQGQPRGAPKNPSFHLALSAFCPPRR